MSIRRLGRVITIRSLLATSGIGALVQFVTFGLNISFIPIFADGLGATKTDLGTITTVSYLTYGIASLAAALGIRRFSERAFVIGGSVITALTIVILPAMHTVPALLVLQAVNGLARGLVFPVLMGISIKEVPEHERASAMGVFQSIYAIGMFSGPAVAGIITDAIGMTGLFLIVSIFPILSIVAALRWLPATVRHYAVGVQP